MLYNALEESDKPDSELVPVPCDCDPPKAHGPHMVRLGRLRKGGDLHGKLNLKDLDLG